MIHHSWSTQLERWAVMVVQGFRQWSVGSGEFPRILYIPRCDLVSGSRTASKEQQKQSQGSGIRGWMISLFWARKNLQQLFCVQVGSDSQIKQLCSEDGVWPEEHHNDSALGVRLWLYVKENDDDDNVNNGHNLHLLGSFNATFSKLL